MSKMFKINRKEFAVFVSLLIFCFCYIGMYTACSRGDEKQAASEERIIISGAWGLYPIMAKWAQ
jgi:ABC-type phosphate transport system substrate-binding protein